MSHSSPSVDADGQSSVLPLEILGWLHDVDSRKMGSLQLLLLHGASLEDTDVPTHNSEPFVVG